MTKKMILLILSSALTILMFISLIIPLTSCKHITIVTTPKKKQTRFYYYPAFQVYYNPITKRYIVYRNKRWIYTLIAPRGIKHAHYVIINDNNYNPWKKHYFYQRKYPSNYSPSDRKHYVPTKQVERNDSNRFVPPGQAKKQGKDFMPPGQAKKNNRNFNPPGKEKKHQDRYKNKDFKNEKKDNKHDMKKEKKNNQKTNSPKESKAKDQRKEKESKNKDLKATKSNKSPDKGKTEKSEKKPEKKQDSKKENGKGKKK